MAIHEILKWPEGQGWLILSGGADALGAVRARALERASGEGNIAYISFAGDAGDALMDDMEDLGAPTGYLIDIQHEDKESVREQLREISLIAVESGDSVNVFRTALAAAKSPLLEAYQQGVVILLEGEAASLAGRWVIDDDGHLVDGLNWLANVFIVSGVDRLSEAARFVLAEHAPALAIAIGKGSALALGPNHRIELWGEGKVTISLGRDLVDDSA